MSGEIIDRSATLSPCRAYRYDLVRRWSDALPTLAFVGLNPSTADEEEDDATVRRCVAFARREGAGGLVMLNAYALRSTDPAGLRRAADPVGPENDATLRRHFGGGDVVRVVAAWGANVALERERVIERIAAAARRPLHCLGRTKFGFPRHPLYVPAATPLEPWSFAG